MLFKLEWLWSVYKQAGPLGLYLCWKHLCPALQLKVMVPFISRCYWGTELSGAVCFGGLASFTLGSVCSDWIQMLLFSPISSFVLKRSGIFLIQSIHEIYLRVESIALESWTPWMMRGFNGYCSCFALLKVLFVSVWKIADVSLLQRNWNILSLHLSWYLFSNLHVISALLLLLKLRSYSSPGSGFVQAHSAWRDICRTFFIWCCVLCHFSQIASSVAYCK